MAPSAAYYQWLNAGKPLTPALPVREYVDQLKVAFPAAAAKNLFSWYANDAHYQANPPQDHTPYSATGWPITSPKWIVFATDVMHRVDLGVDCFKLFPYWLAEAKAGRTPWVKYLIWQAKIYDVRNAWAPQTSSDHYDHIHISMRSDMKDRGLGNWRVVPGGSGEMIFVISDGPRKGFAGRSAGGTYQFAANGTQLAQWRKDAGGVADTPVTEAEILAGRLGRDVDTLGGGTGGGVSEAQVKDIIRDTRLMPAE